jgi:hypothetical protein
MRIAEVPADSTDDCEVVIQFNHSSGCVEYNLNPFFRIFGILMIVCGVAIMYFGEDR